MIEAPQNRKSADRFDSSETYGMIEAPCSSEMFTLHATFWHTKNVCVRRCARVKDKRGFRF